MAALLLDSYSLHRDGSLELWLAGKPTPQARHRHARGRTYDPSKADKIAMATSVEQGMLSVPHAILNAPCIGLSICFHMQIPKSWSKKKQIQSLNSLHTSKPDVDNLLKFLMDGFNQILWYDDAIISKVEMKKVYSRRGGVKITITPYEEGRIV